MKITNSVWNISQNSLWYFAEASELSYNRTDPWNRQLPSKQRLNYNGEGEVISWSYDVVNPDGAPVTLTVFND